MLRFAEALQRELQHFDKNHDNILIDHRRRTDGGGKGLAKSNGCSKMASVQECKGTGVDFKLMMAPTDMAFNIDRFSSASPPLLLLHGAHNPHYNTQSPRLGLRQHLRLRQLRHLRLRQRLGLPKLRA